MDEKNKETISGYTDASIATAARQAAALRGKKLAAWVSEAIEEKLEREGMIPAKLAETRSLTSETLATVEIVGAERVLESLKLLRGSCAREKAGALSC